jgi:hypothetical protein
MPIGNWKWKEVLNREKAKTAAYNGKEKNKEM